VSISHQYIPRDLNPFATLQEEKGRKSRRKRDRDKEKHTHCENGRAEGVEERGREEMFTGTLVSCLLVPDVDLRK
jgi:hypothetical protein